MQAAALTPELRAAAPALAGRLGELLVCLVALIARGLLRYPARVALIVPLWNRLKRTVRRLDCLMARIAEGKDIGQSCASRPRAASPDPPSRPRLRLPATYGWLLNDLKHEAAHFTNRLDTLLLEPETAALMAHCPRIASLLRPVCHMLGVRHAIVTQRAPRQPGPRPALPPPPGQPASGAVAATPLHALAMERSRCPPQADPPFRPLHETAPCEHVFWPWFPRKLRPGG